MNYYNNYNPMQNNPIFARNQPFYATQQIIRVNGKNGAETLNLAPNESVIALDQNNPILWVVTSDGAGYKTVNAFDIKPHQVETPTQADPGINDRISAIETRLSEMEAKLNEPDIKPVKQSK